MTSDASNTRRCPWCSAALPTRGALTACPSCGASLVQADEEIPGLTRVDPEVLIRSKPAPARSRLLGWLSGDTEPLPAAAPQARMAEALAGVDDRASLEPPSDAVRREMRRLEQLAVASELAASGVVLPSEDVAPAATPSVDEPVTGPEGVADPEDAAAASSPAPAKSDGRPRRTRTKGSTAT